MVENKQPFLIFFKNVLVQRKYREIYQANECISHIIKIANPIAKNAKYEAGKPPYSSEY